LEEVAELENKSVGKNFLNLKILTSNLIGDVIVLGEMAKEQGCYEGYLHQKIGQAKDQLKHMRGADHDAFNDQIKEIEKYIRDYALVIACTEHEKYIRDLAKRISRVVNIPIIEVSETTLELNEPSEIMDFDNK